VEERKFDRSFFFLHAVWIVPDVSISEKVLMTFFLLVSTVDSPSSSCSKATTEMLHLSRKVRRRRLRWYMPAMAPRQAVLPLKVPHRSSLAYMALRCDSPEGSGRPPKSGLSLAAEIAEPIIEHALHFLDLRRSRWNGEERIT
jgi:hypothetical protein